MNADERGFELEKNAMTLVELENTLPNGFHDAYIMSITMDYVKGELRVGMSLSFAGPDDPPEVPRYRRAIVSVSGVKLFVIDPPDSDPNYSILDADEQPANGFITCTSDYWSKKIDQRLIEASGSNAPLYSFFIGSWNSCIHIAASDATYEWADEKT